MTDPPYLDMILQAVQELPGKDNDLDLDLQYLSQLLRGRSDD